MKKYTGAVKIFLFILFSINSSGLLTAQDKSKELKLSLNEVIELAIKNSRSIMDFRLSRDLEATQLKYEKRKFEPVLRVGTGTDIEHDYTKNGGLFSRINSSKVGFNADASILLPTGAKISYGWEGGYFNESTNYSTAGSGNNDFVTQGGVLSVTQPLLKGAWFDVNYASLDIAALADSINYQSFRAYFGNTIAAVIYAYRNIILTERVSLIAENSLSLSEELFEMNKALVTTGIIARTDLVQNQSQVTSARYQLMSAQNNLKSARLALNDLLDIDINYNISPGAIDPGKDTEIDSTRILKIAFENNVNYKTALYNVKIAEKNLMLAKDNKKIDLNLFSQYRNNTNSTSPYILNNNFQLGINLSYNLTDRTRDLVHEQSLINLDRAKNNLKLVENDIRVKISEKLRDLRLKKELVEIARQISSFAKQKLEVEKEKMKIGKSATFTLVTFHNELVRAENEEISSLISYLNSLTSLQLYAGNILEEYNVIVN